MYTDHTKISILEHPQSMALCMSRQSDRTIKNYRIWNKIPENQKQ